jgi:subtilisin family serine protease
MAVPHVAGMAAIYLEQHPEATPAQVHDALVAAANAGVLDESQMRSGTPNKLLYAGVL